MVVARRLAAQLRRHSLPLLGVIADGVKLDYLSGVEVGIGVRFEGAAEVLAILHLRLRGLHFDCIVLPAIHVLCLNVVLDAWLGHYDLLADLVQLDDVLQVVRATGPMLVPPLSEHLLAVHLAIVVVH